MTAKTTVIINRYQLRTGTSIVVGFEDEFVRRSVPSVHLAALLAESVAVDDCANSSRDDK